MQGNGQWGIVMSEVMVPLSAVAVIIVMWSVLVATVNFGLWFYLLKRRLPQTENKYMTLIEEKEKKYMRKLDDIIEGKDEKFNKIIEDQIPIFVEKVKAEIPDIDEVFDRKLPTVIEQIKAEIPDIDGMIDKGWDKLLDKLNGPPDPKMVGAMSTLAKGAYYNIVGDPDIKHSIDGTINGKMNGVIHQLENRIGMSEEDIKNLRELIAFFNANKDKFGALAGAAGGGGGAFNPLAMFGQMMQGGQG